MKYIWFLLLSLFLSACSTAPDPEGIAPAVITEPTRHDTDDPAIWVNPDDPAASIIFGTDKETDGAIYAYDLAGKMLPDKTIRPLRRPNNVDIEYGFTLAGDTMDILVATEREAQQLRLWSVPDMRPLDGGGFPLFEGETGEAALPMGVAIYKDPDSTAFSIIVGRKYGPTDGSYLAQFALETIDDRPTLRLQRRFGAFSGGESEIEAIAVDDELGYVYYADELVGIRKYHADPAMGNAELALFGKEGFAEDIEGIAILRRAGGRGYLYVSDQQGGAVRLFERSGANAFVTSVAYQAIETDGLEVAGVALNATFPHGLLVAMSEGRVFHYYPLNAEGLPVTSGDQAITSSSGAGGGR